MNRTIHWLLLALTTLLLMLVAHASESLNFHDANAIVAEYKQWMIGANGTGPVIPHSARDHRSNYNLKGSVPKRFLQCEKQGAGQGINLGWTSDASAKSADESAEWHSSFS